MASLIIKYISEAQYQIALLLVFVFLVAGLVYVFFHHYNYVAYKDYAKYFHITCQKKIMDKVASLDENFTKDMSTAYIVNSAYSDVGNVQTMPDRLFDAITHLIGMLVAVIILASVNLFMGVAALILIVVSMAYFTYTTGKRNHYLAEQRREQDKITELFGQIIDGNREIKVFDMEQALNDYLEDYKKSWRSDFFKMRKYRNYAAVFSPAILSLGRLVIYLILIALILAGRYDLSILVLAIGYYEDIENKFEDINETLDKLLSYSVRLDRIDRILKYETKHMRKFGDNAEDNIKGIIRFIDVSFKYDKQESLNKLNLTIKPNTFTAIVGKSGSGKSTIFRLLLRLYRASKGTILLDDINIYDYAPDIYASNVSIVTQKPFLFDLTIRQNLDLVDKNQDSQVAACQRVGIHNWIISLPYGYETKLENDAENMSAGQKQLLALARTLLSQSEVLLFDEVTSSLDAKTSEQIFKIMQDLARDHTVLVITHKPELMQLAEEIIVIHKGKITGKGTHQSLLAKNKHYRMLQKP